MLIIFKQVALHFHFALGPADYAAGPGQKARVWEGVAT